MDGWLNPATTAKGEAVIATEIRKLSGLSSVPDRSLVYDGRSVCHSGCCSLFSRFQFHYAGLVSSPCKVRGTGDGSSHIHLSSERITILKISLLRADVSNPLTISELTFKQSTQRHKAYEQSRHDKNRIYHLA